MFMHRFLVLPATAATLASASSAPWAQGPSIPPPASPRLKRRGLVSGKDVSIVRRIQHSHDPVRRIGTTDISGGQGATVQSSDFGLAGSSTPKAQAYNGGSRIEASTQTFLSRETIIVDGKQTGGISYGQLADYLALVTLASSIRTRRRPGPVRSFRCSHAAVRHPKD